MRGPRYGFDELTLRRTGGGSGHRRRESGCRGGCTDQGTRRLADNFWDRRVSRGRGYIGPAPHRRRSTRGAAPGPVIREYLGGRRRRRARRHRDDAVRIARRATHGGRTALVAVVATVRGHGHCRSAGTIRTSRSPDARRLSRAPRRRYRYIAHATQVGIAAWDRYRRAAGARRHDYSHVARVSGQPERARAGGTVHGRTSGIFDPGIVRGPSPLAVRIAAHAWPSRTASRRVSARRGRDGWRCRVGDWIGRRIRSCRLSRSVSLGATWAPASFVAYCRPLLSTHSLPSSLDRSACSWPLWAACFPRLKPHARRPLLHSRPVTSRRYFVRCATPGRGRHAVAARVHCCRRLWDCRSSAISPSRCCFSARCC